MRLEPRYDRSKVTTGLAHIGVGGFHRAHLAMYHDRLLAAGGAREWGICGVGMLEGDRRMAEVMRAQHGLYTLVEKPPDGDLRARVIGSLTEYLLAPQDPEAVIEKLAAPGTRIVSLTITEGGYGPDSPALAPVVEALRRRRERGTGPCTVMSCDNLEGNGAVARRAFTGFAR